MGIINRGFLVTSPMVIINRNFGYTIQVIVKVRGNESADHLFSRTSVGGALMMSNVG